MRALKTFLGDAVGLAVLLIAGELLVRACCPQTARYLFTNEITGGHPIRYNSLGLRDEEFPVQKPPEERRILCAGDSTTFGAGLSLEETYPKQLEKMLDPSNPSPWRVINAGGQGASLSEITNLFVREWMRLEPSVVILGFCPTMVSVAGRSGALEPTSKLDLSRKMQGLLLSAHMALHSSYLYVLFDAEVRQRLYLLGITRDRMDNPVGGIFSYAFDVPGVRLEEVETRYQTLEQELAEFKRILDKRGIRLLVLGLPSRFHLSADPRDNQRRYDLTKIRVDPMDRMQALCGKHGIPFVDLRKRLTEERRRMLRGEQSWDDLYIPLDYAHLNATGMRAAAEELETALRDWKR